MIEVVGKSSGYFFDTHLKIIFEFEIHKLRTQNDITFSSDNLVMNDLMAFDHWQVN